MALKKLKDIKLDAKLKGTIASGYESDDSKAELIIAEPLQQHPEIKGLYRAFDPDTGWKTWVAYTPPTPTPEPPTTPDPAEVIKKEFIMDYKNLQKMEKAIQYGFITDTDQNYLNLKDKVKNSFKIDYLDVIE